MATYQSKSKTSLVRVTVDVFGTSYRYSNFSGVQEGFTAMPTLEVREVQYQGDMQDDTAQILISTRDDDGLSARLLQPGTIADAKVYAEEVLVDATGVAQDIRPIFRGQLDSIQINPSGNLGQAVLQCGTLKAATDTTAGLTCSEFCPHVLGGLLCGVDTSAFELTGTVSSYDSTTRKVLLTDFAAPAQDTISRGSLVYEGVRLLIREYNVDVPGELVLGRQMPSSWIGQQVTVEPGCSKTESSCNAFGNIENHGAIGRRMLSYDPQWEIEACPFPEDSEENEK